MAPRRRSGPCTRASPRTRATIFVWCATTAPMGVPQRLQQLLRVTRKVRWKRKARKAASGCYGAIRQRNLPQHALRPTSTLRACFAMASSLITTPPTHSSRQSPSQPIQHNRDSCLQYGINRHPQTSSNGRDPHRAQTRTCLHQPAGTLHTHLEAWHDACACCHGQQLSLHAAHTQSHQTQHTKALSNPFQPCRLLTHLKAWHDARAGCHCQQLNLDTAHPADGWQVVVHQQVVGLILKAPLADDQAGTCTV